MTHTLHRVWRAGNLLKGLSFHFPPGHEINHVGAAPKIAA